MIKKLSFGLCLIIFVLIVAFEVLVVSQERKEVEREILGGTDEATYQYSAGAVDRRVVSGPAVLHKLVIGKNVAGSEVRVIDDTATPSDRVVFHLIGDSLAGVYDVNAYFTRGIIITVTNQTNTTLLYSPR